MNIGAIKTFLTVVQTGNLNRAAEVLHVTQSAVTTRLDALEEQLGQKLLVRSRRGAKMTKAGFAFHATAQLIVNSWESAYSKANLPQAYSGIFSLACHFDLWISHGREFLNQAQQIAPTLAFEAWPGDQPQLGNWLQSGMVDAAISTDAIAGTNITPIELACDRIIQVSTTKRKVTDWDNDYIMVDHGPEIRQKHAIEWPENKTAHMTFGGSEWALEYLLNNGGSAYLPWRLVENHLRERMLFVVEGAPEFSKKIHLSIRDNWQNEFPWIDKLVNN